MGKFLTFFISIIVLVNLSACDRAKKYSSDNLPPEVAKVFEDIQSSLGTGASKMSDLTSEQVQKLLTIEYHVFEVPFDTGASAIEEALQGRGKERWDCFSIVPDPEKRTLRVSCKRYPISYFRILPYLFRL